MDVTTLKPETLGEKHKHYNELLRKTLENESIELQDIDFDKNDQDNFLMIDIACEKKDVQFILNILKSGDLLYITKALQKCTWLFTDNQYAHIINPTYLHNHLLPEMSTKAGNKLMKRIREKLNNEQRVEEFFTHEKSFEIARKWLPNCSVQFIENNITKYADQLDVTTFRRLCEKSMNVFEIVVKKNIPQSFYDSAIFLLNTHTDRYLDAINEYYCPRFNAKATNILMKKVPERITKNFEKYVHYIDIPTFAKNMKKEEIKDFLYEQASKDFDDNKYFYLRRFLNSHKVMHLIKRIPKQDRFEFVKNVFIDKIPTENDEGVVLRPEMYKIQKLSEAVCLKKYEWYIFAPFDTAFEEIKKMIITETEHDKKYSMLETLILCASKSEKDLQAVLQYYLSNHVNDDNQLKNQFISNLMKNTNVYKCNNNTWQILNDIFKSMDVYMVNYNNFEDCIILIILHHVLNNEDVPQIIEHKFSFDFLERFRHKINSEEKEKVFKFLFNYLMKKIQNRSILTQDDFIEIKETLENMLFLLDIWKKELLDFPLVHSKIKEMAIIKKEKSWNTSLSTLYNINVSWRKDMFEESFLLDPNEEVCINALKHDPGLLLRYKDEVQKLCFNDKISLRIVLAKLRTYWPESLAINWVNEYQERLNVMGSHKATTRGICSLVPQKSLLDIIKKYAPEKPKVNWKEVDEVTFSLQKHIAKNMHIARPQIDPNAVFWYAKGDYLQYALPSLLAVFYNMNSIQSREFIPKLLDSPVSVQKHGIRFAFLKLDTNKLNTLFLNIWNNAKNPTIRAELFKHTFKLLISKETEKVEEIASLLELFIDNLTHKDDPKILNSLVNIGEVPMNVRANYLVKSYNIYKRLLPHFTSKDIDSFKNHMQTLAEHSREVMETINEEFVVQIIQSYFNTEFFNSKGKCTTRVMHHHGIIKVISAYLLSANDVETQTQRYEKVLSPIIKRVFALDNNASEESFNKDNFAAILKRLYLDLNQYVMEKKFIIPYKMFSDIQEELKSLPVPENYVTLTMWKLTTALTKLLSENDTNCKWEEIIVKIAPEFSEICTTYLKEDVNTRFSCIYIIFARVLKQFVDTMPIDAVCILCKGMIKDANFIQGFLTVIAILPTGMYLEETIEVEYNEIHKIIFEQPSPEIKMHYYNTFKRYIGQ